MHGHVRETRTQSDHPKYLVDSFTHVMSQGYGLRHYLTLKTINGSRIPLFNDTEDPHLQVGCHKYVPLTSPGSSKNFKETAQPKSSSKAVESPSDTTNQKHPKTLNRRTQNYTSSQPIAYQKNSMLQNTKHRPPAQPKVPPRLAVSRLAA